ncbi:PEP/pyruvate-binding domain-containing protein [Paenibacillus sp. CN-4]|uniref:PEP/pyruvate-binding domain-containing protein n=1 Tax=Paenibacillus nanchangensis TaxID=3348343 RepID=UPI00397BC375
MDKSRSVLSFREMVPEDYKFAGGKGAMLARLYQQGYPVPEGFVVFPVAFEGENVAALAWDKVVVKLQAIRKKHAGALFAVRSSGLSEDSAAASYAGEFETVLNVETDEEVRQALGTVIQSVHTERVQVYSLVQGMDAAHRMAIVVQLMVPSEISGVLFTADPITGSRAVLPGNYVLGLGEQLVSGESNASSFTLTRPGGRYNGPREFRRYAARLYKYASKIEKELGSPQDMEWAVAGGKVYLLQTRPITTLSPGNREVYAVNDSLTGDYVWTNYNVGESIADVCTPLTWSLLRSLDTEHGILPGQYMFSGNICGRVYANVSLSVSMFSALGLSIKPILKKMSRVFGVIPEGMNVPVYPYSKRELLKTVLPKMVYSMKRTREAVRTLPQHLKETPEWCGTMDTRLREARSADDLLRLWNEELWPRNMRAMWSGLEAHAAKMQQSEKFLKKLSRLVGEEDAHTLLSNAGGGTELESLGPMTGISRVVKGKMSRSEYMLRYGHRGPHEFELSIPGPAEDELWLDQQIAEYCKAPLNAEELLQQQMARAKEAWERLKRRYPQRIKRLAGQITDAAEGPRVREAVRSEWTRTFRLNRTFALKAGELAGVGDDVFFLYLDEILGWLAGGPLPYAKDLSMRKEMVIKYKGLPPLPSVIRGRFDPWTWVKDPNRRLDYYDASVKTDVPDGDTLKGFAGAAGRIEGKVRVLACPEEGHQLLPGEILVASTTNVGWTPLFPRSAAIITDIGAPLSHAAIVARELGIPAVVGCGTATSRLKTGDHVLVDGGQGLVLIRKD